MISRLIQSASIDMKMDMETLLNGGEITVCFDEQIVFSQLENDENAVWSLMVASGYLKVCEVEYRGMMGKPWYHLAVTNMETLSMFTGMFTGWFADKSTNYSSFVKALVGGRGDKTANKTLNRAADTTRQPGSTFKIIAAYAPALDAGGLTLASVQDDAPYNYGSEIGRAHV